MKIIGAGFSRTGTMSMQVALQRLGYRPYHMFESLRNFENGHLDMWNEYMEAKAGMDWQYLFSEYDAVTDLPACIYWQEMMDAFPDAKVVLTVRDAEAWWESWINLVKSQMALVDQMAYLPRFSALDRMVINVERVWFQIKPNQYEKEDAIARFHEHNQAVKAAVPPERLLVINVREGWSPLCEFLGVPVPDEAFPHENIGTTQVEAIMGELVQADIAKYGPPPQKS